MAEKLIFGEVTTGASNDIERVTGLARKMVTEYGMSDRIGPLQLGRKEESPFLGREIGEQRNYSEETAREIDEEVRQIVQEALATAERTLTEHKGRLILISERLIQQESLEGPEFEALFVEPLPEGLSECEDERQTVPALATSAKTRVVASVAALASQNGHAAE